MKNKLPLIIIIIVILGITGYGLTKNKATTTSNENKVEVAASFYPLYFFASEIGKEKTSVFSVTPNGIEPHDYEPKPQDIVRIQKSKILLINGAGFEPWVEKIKDELKEKNVNIVDTTMGLELQKGEHHEHEEEDITAEAETEDEHEEEPLDPHVWLSPVLAKEQVDKITAGYIKADPQNKDFYQKNADELKEKLDILHTNFQVGLQSCQQRHFVTSHSAFGYLANTYNIEQLSISGLSPQEEPSAAKLAEITNFVKENNIDYIFFETLISPDLSETIARETGIKTLILDPIEGVSKEDQNLGKNYITIMEQNLKNLQTALHCTK